jgi:L-iditol 2-dehydrogenase
MKAAVLTEPGAIAVREVERPSLDGGAELLVRVACCGICTLEQRLFSGAMKIGYPLVPGHEAAGEIVEVRPGAAAGFRPGMRVALDLVYRCGYCRFCRTGHSNLCVHRFDAGVHVLGGFGQYVAVRATQAFPIPETLSFEEAAFAEPLACCIHSLTKVGLRMAEDLLVIGAGPMGQMHLQAALCMGARVFVSDPDQARLELARTMGAFQAIDPSAEDLRAAIARHTDGRGVDACVLTSPALPALADAVQAVAKSGRVNIYTSYTDQPAIPLDANTLHRSEITLTGTEGRTERDFEQAVRLLAFGKVNVRPLVSRKVGYADLVDGIRAAMAGTVYRVLLEHERP